MNFASESSLHLYANSKGWETIYYGTGFITFQDGHRTHDFYRTVSGNWRKAAA